MSYSIFLVFEAAFVGMPSHPSFLILYRSGETTPSSHDGRHGLSLESRISNSVALSTTRFYRHETSASSRQARPKFNPPSIYCIPPQVVGERPPLVRSICLGSTPPLLPPPPRSNQFAGRTASFDTKRNLVGGPDHAHDLPDFLSCVSAASGCSHASRFMDHGVYCCGPGHQLYNLHVRPEWVSPGCSVTNPRRGAVQPGPGVLVLHQRGCRQVSELSYTLHCSTPNLETSSHFWLQKNVNQLSYTFGRKVTGIHNRT